MASQKILIKFLGIFFKGPPAKQRYQSFLSKKCVTARKVDTASLESKNLTYIRDLKELHWDPILELDDLVFESYTKLFHANLNVEGDINSLKVYLKGREVEIFATLLNQILGFQMKANELPRRREIWVLRNTTLFVGLG